MVSGAVTEPMKRAQGFLNLVEPFASLGFQVCSRHAKGRDWGTPRVLRQALLFFCFFLQRGHGQIGANLIDQSYGLVGLFLLVPFLVKGKPKGRPPDVLSDSQQRMGECPL